MYHIICTHQNASTKNLPASSNASPSFSLLLTNLTFRGLNNTAPIPNIGGPTANANTDISLRKKVMQKKIVVNIRMNDRFILLLFVVGYGLQNRRIICINGLYASLLLSY